MKQIIKIALLSVLIIIPNWEVAANSNYTHTHTNTPIELGFVSANIGTQYAAVCFLGTGDCGAGSFGKGDDDMTANPGDQCKNEGYDKTCPAGWHPEIGKKCPHDPRYVKCCKETCPANAATSCTGEAVGDDNCGYTCKKCCSISCPAEYKKNIPSGYVQDGEPCLHCTNGPMYKTKINPCNGFQTCQYGQVTGATTCLSGAITKYSACRPCNTSCPYGSYTYRTGSGGCGGSSIMNECRTQTCYYPYKACPCYPSCYDEYGCSFGENYISDGCGGTCTKCKPAIVCEDQRVYDQVYTSHCEGTTWVGKSCTMIQDYYISNGSCVRGMIQFGCIGDTKSFSYPNSNVCK